MDNTPCSDIDLRLAIADTGYHELWEHDRSLLLRGLDQYLPLLSTFVRVLTSDGIIVEARAFCRDGI